MLRGSVNGAGFEAPGSILPASLWHPDTTKAQALLDTIDGRMKTVDCRDLGEEAVPVAGAETAARHFRLTGEIERDVWRSEEHTSELQSLMRISYAVFCLKKNKQSHNTNILL